MITAHSLNNSILLISCTNRSLYIFDEKNNFKDMQKLKTNSNVLSFTTFGSKVLLGEMSGFVEVIDEVYLKIVKT